MVVFDSSWRAGGNRILLELVVLRGGDPSDMTSIPARALLDAGATVSGIGPRIVQTLGLASHSKKRLKSATEEAFVDYYLFRIGFHAGDAELGDVPQLPFVFEASDGFSWARSADFDVILGMDVLRQCDFTMDRSGSRTLRFG